jgi:hypothetical protein
MKLIMRTEPQVYARIAAYFRLNTPRNHSLVLCSSCQTLQIEKGRTALKKFVSGGKLHEQRYYSYVDQKRQKERSN